MITSKHGGCGLLNFFLIAAVFAVVQIIEGFILTPRILGKSVGIHPIGVILAFIVGAELFGLLGIIIAIPAAAAFRVLFHHMLKGLEQGE